MITRDRQRPLRPRRAAFVSATSRSHWSRDWATQVKAGSSAVRWDQGHVFAERIGLDREPACPLLSEGVWPAGARPDGDLAAGSTSAGLLGTTFRTARGVVDNVRRVVRGRDAAVELVTCALLSGGHVLIEDVPGSGKTTLARAFARSVGGSFHRVQGTADLLPADITGSGVWLGQRRPLVPLRARSGLRACAARRRAQPACSTHPVGLPGGDGGVRRHR